MSTELTLPANASITLDRVGDSEYFHVSVEGEPMAEIVHKDADLWKAIELHYKVKRTRAELDGGLW